MPLGKSAELEELSKDKHSLSRLKRLLKYVEGQGLDKQYVQKVVLKKNDECFTQLTTKESSEGYTVN